MKFFLVCASFLVLSSCAHKTMRGTVVMKVDEKTGYVCHMDQKVNVGDAVTAYQSNCRAGREKIDCTHRTTANGSISKLINDHYAEVVFDANSNFSEGSFVNIKTK